MTTDPASRPGTVHRQKARRVWYCQECPEEIQAGSTYIYLNTLKDGRWSRYVLCLECERIRSCHRVTELSLGADLPYGAGALRRDVKGFHRTVRGYAHEFRIAWSASEPRASVLPPDPSSPPKVSP